MEIQYTPYLCIIYVCACACVCIGAEIDCEDKSRNTALHIAARFGHELIITALIKHGANTAKLVIIDIHLSFFFYLPPEYNPCFINKEHK